MSVILQLETSSTNCSVAISKNGKTLALIEDYNTSYSHAERLHVFIDQALKQVGIQTNQLDAIAVSKGPGSYTGLRIGVSAAKGLCYALNIPLLSISTLEALAHQATIKSGYIIPLLDARRMEVYAAVYNFEYAIQRPIKAEIIEPNSFASYLKKDTVTFIGTGVEKTKPLLTHRNAQFIENKLPSANSMSRLAFAKYKKNDIEDVAYFEPYYLKDFIAIKAKPKF